ncbi:MAG TPA: DUF2085 domain-containing protein, partial [Anaerolineae bacterium]
AIALVAALLPKQLLQSLDLVGYAVCHRIPERSFFIANIQLPLCARDTGMFSGALLGIISFVVVQRKRVAQFPVKPFLFVLAAFFLIWGFDGFNSYMLLLRGQVLIYMPQNWLRLVTGAFMGITLSSFVVPLFNSAVWQPQLASNEPSVGSWRTVGRLAVIAVGIIVVVLWQPDFLYGPIALISTFGVLTLLVVVNMLLVILLMKRESRYERWGQLIFPLIAGICFTFTEIMLIDIVRAALTQQFHLPF